MSRIQSVMKMHMVDRMNWWYLPWSILLFSFGVNFLIGFLTQGNSPIYTGGIASIYIYMLVIGTVSLFQTFPFALGFSIRRTDYFLGTTAMVSIISAAWALALIILSILETKTGLWGVNLHFFNLPYLHDGTYLEQYLISFVLMLHFFFTGFAITCFGRRFGLIGMVVAVILLILVMSISFYVIRYQDLWNEIWLWFTTHSAFQLTLWSLPVIGFYLIVSHLLLRKTTI